MAEEHSLEDDETAERSPDNRYHRSTELVGKGRFKKVYKAFDSQNGIDVAWSKISADANNLSPEQLSNIANDIRTGLKLDHPNIIKCFQCWEDEEAGCINLITELFTSGNLRQYRTLHRNVDPKASKRMARQILKGLQYLHSMQPPIAHGDLRCDKIYVNGHSGEIKVSACICVLPAQLGWSRRQGSLDRTRGGAVITAVAAGLVNVDLFLCHRVHVYQVGCLCGNTHTSEQIAQEHRHAFSSKPGTCSLHIAPDRNTTDIISMSM